MVSLALPLLVAMAMAPEQSEAKSIAPSCQHLDPVVAVPSGKRRAITPDDLLRLRDVGRGDDGLWDESPLAISPDGKFLAFQIRQADARSNSYCLAMYILPVGSPAALGRVDAGGQLITGTMSIRGLAAFPLGTAKTIVPRWSPDGTAIAYLRGDGGPAQLWLAKRDGSGARPVAASPIDILDFRWSDDGKALYVATRPELERADQAISEEGQSGYHFDDRFSPAVRSRPFVREPAPQEWAQVDPGSGSMQPLSKSTADVLNGSTSDPRLPSGPKQVSGRRIAWAAQRSERYNAPRVLHFSSDGSATTLCELPQCDGVIAFGFAGMGDALWYVRRQGFGLEDMAIYLWHPGQAPRQIHSITGILSGCVSGPGSVLCVEETSAKPQQIMRYNLEDGSKSVLLDLNPEFRSIALGRVQRLHVKTQYGVDAFADLILPPDHRPGQRHPLVIVQYQSRGFLRGGTGDEAPIFALTRRGLAVLSFNRPKDFYTDPADTWSEYLRAVQHDRIDRRNIMSALDSLIEAAIGTKGVNRRPNGTPDRRAKGTPSQGWHDGRGTFLALRAA
ncbi:Atxe2 family lasso peptide isopeptidase [Sphingobium sp. CAP-1]|uniref:Atxe2 family lasso peptide isopeptidase n=1 Tax=Sphingobium sp. CAP-1 TaxID=2676077 RepID=UPI0012BB3C92|nr:Atxe2 family lasso peptide isopeptidase [Sphingobium sp. CAP-1]QGP78090.1 Atxe2 family lasso peptide isopeptidase [Sphingobium sp. CAP-1]